VGRLERRLFDRERPVEVGGRDRDLERARIFGHVRRALSRALFVYGLLKIAAADRALKDQREGAGALGILVFRPPVHAQRAGQAEERFRLCIPAA
jgi:hypothetical protein